MASSSTLNVLSGVRGLSASARCNKNGQLYRGSSPSAPPGSSACWGNPCLESQGLPTRVCQPSLSLSQRVRWQHSLGASELLQTCRSARRGRPANATGAGLGASSDSDGPDISESSTSQSDGPVDGNVPSTSDAKSGGPPTAVKKRDAWLLGKDAVRNYGFLGELPTAFRVLLSMRPVYVLGLILLQTLLWFIQEMLQVAIVKLIRALDPPSLIIVNQLSVFTAATFLLLNLTYLTLATGLSLTALTRTVAATLSRRPVRIRDTLRDWWAHARPLAVAQLKVYWPLLLMVLYAGLEGDRFLDDTRTRQLELIQEMKILNRVNPLTLIALYPGLRLLRIASFFSYFFYSLTVLPLLGFACPALLLEGISSAQAVRQRRFPHPPSFRLYRLLPLLTPLAIMFYYTFFTKAPLPISTVTILEWSHQVRARLGKAAWLVVASTVQVLLYISYRKAKDGDAFGSAQLGEYVDGGEGREEQDQGAEGPATALSKEAEQSAGDEP